MIVEKQSGRGGGFFFLTIFPVLGLLVCAGFLWAALNAKQVFPGERNFHEVHFQLLMLQKKMQEDGSTPLQVRIGENVYPAEDVLRELQRKEDVIATSLPVVERYLPLAALAGIAFFLALFVVGVLARSSLRKAEAGIAAAGKYFGLSLPNQESPKLQNIVGTSRLLTALSSLALAAFWGCAALVVFHYYLQPGEDSIGKYASAAAGLAAAACLLGFFRAVIRPDLSDLKKKEKDDERGVFDGHILRGDEALGTRAFVAEYAGKAGVRMPDHIAAGDDGELFATTDNLDLTEENTPASGLSLYVSRPLLAFMSKVEAAALIVWSLARLQPDENRKNQEFVTLDEEAENCERYLHKSFASWTLNNRPALAFVQSYRRALSVILATADSEKERSALRKAESVAGRENLSVAFCRQAVLHMPIQDAVFEALDKGGKGEAIPERVKKALADLAPVLRGTDASGLAALPLFSRGGANLPPLVELLALQGIKLDQNLLDKALTLRYSGLPQELGLIAGDPHGLFSRQVMESDYEAERVAQSGSPGDKGVKARGAAEKSGSLRRAVDEKDISDLLRAKNVRPDEKVRDPGLAAVKRAGLPSGPYVPSLEELQKMPSRELWEMAFTATPEVRLKKTGLANSQKAFIAVIVIGGMASYLYQAGNIGLAFMLGLFAFAGLLLTIRRMRMDNKPYLVISGEGLRTPGMAEVIPWANVRAIGFPEDTYDDDSLSDIRIGLRPGYTPPADPDNRRRAGFSSSDGMLIVQAGSFDKKQPPEVQRERIAAYRNAALARAVLQSRGENVRKEYSA